MKRKSLHLALLASGVVSAVAFTFGGWAVITVEDVPEYLEAGKPTRIAFRVRQHGQNGLEGLEPKVSLRSGMTRSSVMAVGSSDRNGRYVATVTAPKAGEWTVRIESGFGPGTLTLRPIRAVAAGSAPPAPLAQAERGHQLFVAKGCVTCHVRGDDGDESMNAGPALTGRSYPAANLAKFLADPSASPLSPAKSPRGKMPNLELKEGEIASLVAFINSERKLSTR